MRERDIAQALAARESGQCEVRTTAGNIDVLTPKYVYEVKVARQWKAALGQVLAYARAYPDRKPRLYLFGELGGITKKAVEEHCRAAGVGVGWHREEDLPVSPPAAHGRRPPPDSMSLSLVVVDATYAIRTSTTIRLPTPAVPIAPEVLEAYADEALTVFDALLDNELIITVSAVVGGATHAAERVRPAIRGTPVCYQLVMTIQPREFGKLFRVTLSGVRTTLPSGASMGVWWKREPPELQRLYAFVRHAQFPWCDQFGHPVSQVANATYGSRGITKTRTGYKLGNGR